MQEVGLLLADSVLSANAALHFADVVHHKGLDCRLCTFLKALILVAWQDHIQVEVAVADVTVTIWQNLSLFSVGEV